jgi:hypothetical protein
MRRSYVGPASRHYVHVLVAAAPGEQPAAARVLVGQPVDRGVRLALRVDAELQDQAAAGADRDD